MTPVPDIISGVVASMRSTGTITSITQNTATQTINTGNTGHLQDGLYVEIGNINYKVSNLVKNSKFDINSLDTITATTWTLACEYTYGHPVEIAKQLTLWDQSASYKFKKFPVICLFLDYEEQVDQDQFKNFVETSLWLAIVTDTDKNYTAKQRLDNKFKLILTPLYELFMDCLRKSRYVMCYDNGNLPHTKIDRYFYGSDGPNQNILNAFADAIEIKNLKIKILGEKGLC